MDYQRIMAQLQQCNEVYENSRYALEQYLNDKSGSIVEAEQAYLYAKNKLKMDIIIPEELELRIYGSMRSAPKYYGGKEIGK